MLRYECADCIALGIAEILLNLEMSADDVRYAPCALYCLFNCHVVGLAWLGLNEKRSLACVFGVVFAEKQMPKLVHIIGVFFPDVRDRDGSSGKPQVGSRDFNLSW